MKVKVRTFGIAGDILGGKEVVLDVKGDTVKALREHLSIYHPALNELKSLFIAVNQTYADDDTALKETDEIAIIPPVSGG